MALFAGIRADFRRFLAYPPGSRFERLYEHRRRAPGGLLERAVVMAAGAFFMAAGFVMLFTPGPGLLAMGFGLVCFACESIGVARWSDRLETRARALVKRFRR